MIESLKDRLTRLNGVVSPGIPPNMGIAINSAEMLVLSFSSLSLLSCPRKFELYKIHPIEAERDTSPALSLGTAVGVGYARYLELTAKVAELDAAGIPQIPNGLAYLAILDDVLLETWLAYYPPLEDNVRSISKAHVIVDKLIETPFAPDGPDDPQDWELATFNGKPAAELSFCIQLTDDIVYVGYLDGVMFSPSTGRYRPLELKTTSLYANLDVNFSNSAQGLAYALILDTITGKKQRTFNIHYRVAQLHRSKQDAYNPTIHDLYFHKTLTDRLEWLIGLQLEVERIERYMEVGMFPKNGANCLAWNRPCQFYGICGLTSNASKNKDEIKEYQFYFKIETLIEEALELGNE